MPNNTNIISKITLPNSVTYQIKDDTLTAGSGIAITSEVNNETFTTTRTISNTGVISVNSKTGNVTLTAEDLGLDKPLNFKGIVTSRESDLSETNVPTISNIENYTPKIGDVIIYNDSGNEYVCIAIDESKTPTEYTWEQFGRNTSVVTQELVDGNNSNNNYPLLFSPETTINTIVAKALKNNYLTYNPYTNNLSLERYDMLNGVSIYNPGTINGHSFGPAMGKDFIDYDDTLFPNGFNYRGIAVKIEGYSYNTYYTAIGSDPIQAYAGDLIYLIPDETEIEAHTEGYYGLCLTEENGEIVLTWKKLTPKSVRPNSDKLITERTLYYYKGNENIDTVGNITEGTWNGDTISVSHGGTGQTSFSRYHILYGNGTDAIQAGPLNWENWETATNIGPKAVFKIGDSSTVDPNLKYTSPAIPTATETQSGIVTAVTQHFGGNKFFTGGQLGIKTKNSNLNKIIFGTQPTPDVSEIDYYTSDTNEWASINVTIPSETTGSNREYFIPQFSFKQYGFSTTYDEAEKPSYTRGHYEEYLLPEVKIDLTSDKTYTILTSKGTLNGALYAASDDAEPQWGTLPVAQGGTGQTSFITKGILYGNDTNAIQSEIPEWKAWVAGTTAGPQAVFHIGGADYTSAAIPAASTSVSGVVTTGNQSFTGIKNFVDRYISISPDDNGEGGEIHLNAAAENTTQAGIILDQFESKFRIFGIASADGETINGVGTPLIIDPYNKTITGGYTLTGSLTGHASLDLPLTGGIVTGYISLKTSYNASLANNGISSGVGYPTTFNILDSAERIMVRNEAVINSNGSIGSYWYVRNYNTEGAQVAQKGIGMYMAKDGTLTYGVSDPAKFRAAIGTWALIADNNGHDALAKADGTYGWVKIGNPDGSLGLLPGTSGSAGSGHNYIGTASWYWKYAYIDEIHGSLTGPTNGYTWDLNTNNTTDTWIPVLNNSTIQHRILPAWLNSLDIVSTAHGGTGNSSYTASRILYTNTATKFASGSLVTDGSYFSRAGVNKQWINGRDTAIIKTTSYSSYDAILSMKTTAGSWELGVYTDNKLYFTYAPDANYGANPQQNSGYKQLRLDPDGTLVAVKFEGPLTGNVTGNVTGDVTGNVTGNVTGHASLDLPLTGGTMTGHIYGATTLTLGGSDIAKHWKRLYLGGSTAASHGIDSGNPFIEFANSNRSQYLQLVYTDNDTEGGQQSVTFVGNSGNTNVWVRAPHFESESSNGLSITPAASTWPYILFGTRAGTSPIGTGTTTYETVNQSTWGMIYATLPSHRRTYATAGNTSSSVTANYYYSMNFFFREYSKTANTTTRLNYYEDYHLPYATDGLTANKTYDILTTKDMSFSITGNAATATKATQDGSGNTITSTYLKLTGGTMSGDLLFANSDTTIRQIRGTVGANDYWRIAGGATASNAGWMEIATADDGNEPIYVRQYTGAYTTIKRTLTLLDASGNTTFPGILSVDHTGQGAKTKGTAYSAFYLAFKNSANNATYATNPIRYIGTDGTDGYNTCIVLGSENGTTWVGAGESSSHMPGKVAYNDENLYLSADGSVKIYTSCANDGSSYSGPVTISGTTITANLTGNVTGNCSGSSGSCTGNAATATSTTKFLRSVTTVVSHTDTSHTAIAAGQMILVSMASPDPNSNGNLALYYRNGLINSANYIVLSIYTKWDQYGRVIIPWVYYNTTSKTYVWEGKICNASGSTSLNVISETVQTGATLFYLLYRYA